MVWTISSYHVRTNKVDEHTLSDCDQKFMTCFPVCKQNRKCNLKLYSMAIKIVTQCSVPRSSVGLLKPGEKGPQNGVSATSSYPDNYQRMGNKNDATDLLKENCEMFNERLSGGTKGVEEAALLDIIALGFMAVGHFNFVGSLLKVMKEVVNTLKDDSEILKLLKRMLNVQEKELGHESDGVIVTLKNIVYYLDKLGRRDEKLPIQRRIFVLQRKYKNQMARY